MGPAGGMGASWMQPTASKGLLWVGKMESHVYEGQLRAWECGGDLSK